MFPFSYPMQLISSPCWTSLKKYNRQLLGHLNSRAALMLKASVLMQLKTETHMQPPTKTFKHISLDAHAG